MIMAHSLTHWLLALSLFNSGFLLFSNLSHAQLPCYTEATEETLLTKNQALLLCCQEPSLGPIECYNAATDELLVTEREALRLCQCAGSSEPVDCYDRAQNQTDLAEYEIVNMCSPNYRNLPPDSPFSQRYDPYDTRSPQLESPPVILEENIELNE